MIVVGLSHSLCSSVLPAAVLTTEAPTALSADYLDQNYLNALNSIGIGQPTLAKQQLQSVLASAPEHLGARLDYALLLCQLGDKAAMQGQLTEIRQRAGANLPLGISAIMSQLESDDCRQGALATQISTAISAGYSSNANFGPRSARLQTNLQDFPLLTLDRSSLGRADYYTQAAINLNRVLSAAEHGIEAGAQLMHRQYQDQPQLNTDLLSLSASRMRDAAHRLTLSASAVMLGGRLITKQLSLFDESSQVIRWLHVTDRLDTQSFQEIRVGVRYQLPLLEQRLMLGMGPIADFSAQRPGGNRYGAMLTLQSSVSDARWLHTVNMDVQFSHDSEAYSRVFSDRRRHTLQASMGLQGRRKSTGSHTPFYKLYLIRQSDNISLFDYQVATLEVGLETMY